MARAQRSGTTTAEETRRDETLGGGGGGGREREGKRRGRRDTLAAHPSGARGGGAQGRIADSTAAASVVMRHGPTGWGGATAGMAKVKKKGRNKTKQKKGHEGDAAAFYRERDPDRQKRENEG